ncbi:alpha/beta hydrolase [Aspergillus ruber CBS 135680]|uniref:Alpha/beta-hydrolase n=1 Tax=Aspergillus ruber (strain CBS 135680) TaxID=1388766 RepID=A0A017S9J4_ASPRC|nr:alpha/beta-hydrolase [Aspergillus ruber CBS 135680]EYE92865.1 alpha/beta-hydrolase [Aspergillus ruber CBS 135680]
MVTNVSFLSRNLKLAGHLYHPQANAPNRNGAAIVISHPWTSIKERSPANYARVLSQAGFICLTFDAAYQGESEGEPRALEDSTQRVEDIKSAMTYLFSRQDVNSDRIGVLGICASGGYAPFATQTDLRIKACATIAAVLQILKMQLEGAAADRNSDVTGNKVPIVHLLPEKPEDAPANMSESFRDLMLYYRTPRAHHPRATNTTIPRNWDIMANFDAFAFNSMISPRPLLMITGTKAASKWHSEEGVAKAKEPKELFIVDGKTHADLYDQVDEAGAKCADFFGKSLTA